MAQAVLPKLSWICIPPQDELGHPDRQVVKNKITAAEKTRERELGTKLPCTYNVKGGRLFQILDSNSAKENKCKEKQNSVM
jgi:hypothetical protein